MTRQKNNPVENKVIIVYLCREALRECQENSSKASGSELGEQDVRALQQREESRATRLPASPGLEASSPWTLCRRESRDCARVGVTVVWDSREAT